jgi:hypothetical protein
MTLMGDDSYPLQEGNGGEERREGKEKKREERREKKREERREEWSDGRRGEV